MLDEPYRWVEAIANRREYIEEQLKVGSPVVGLPYDDGILIMTVSRGQRKVFEIYDRLALSAIGHPADIEKLRILAIDIDVGCLSRTGLVQPPTQPHARILRIDRDGKRDFSTGVSATTLV